MIIHSVTCSFGKYTSFSQTKCFAKKCVHCNNNFDLVVIVRGVYYCSYHCYQYYYDYHEIVRISDVELCIKGACFHF